MMTMRTVLRTVALTAAAALLILAVGCAAPSEGEGHGHDHDHGDETTTPVAPVTQTHEHEEPSNMRLAYEEETDGTLTLIIKDCQGNEILNKKGLTKKSLSEQVTDGIVQLSWVTANLPGGYESLYINRMTCQVSDTIVGEQATDGNRIVYSEIKDGKLNVIVRDLFNKDGYYKSTEIEDAYTGGEYTVIGAIKVAKVNQVNISYLTDKDGGHRIKAFDLYEKGETPPTASAKKTEAAKK